jgi:FkbM family methyltransferase
LEIFHYLCGNVALGGHKNIVALNAALGAAAGSITVPSVDYSHEGNFGAVSLKDMGEGKTEVRTIDGLDLADCRLIKIDVEGMEPEVLKGARETIGRLKPFVYTENKKNEGSPKVIEFFLERDYALYWHFAQFFRDGNFNNVDTNVFDDSGDINMLCVPPGAPMTVDLPTVSGPDADWQVDYPAWRGDR